MHPDDALKTIERFYTCLQAHDAAGMTACYHPEIVFSDPVFGTLRGKEAGAMWHMLLARSTQLTIRFSQVRWEEGTNAAAHGKGAAALAHCEADYPFSRSGRQVHNAIDARFLFQDGLIVQHHDNFNLWRWQSMALGVTGFLLGWTPLLKNKIRKTARQGLEKYMATNVL